MTPRGRPPLIPPESRIHAASLYLQGYTLAEVGTFFGVTRERIRQIIRDMGIIEPRQKRGRWTAQRRDVERRTHFTPELCAYIYQTYIEQGYSKKRTAKYLGVGTGYVEQAFRYGGYKADGNLHHDWAMERKTTDECVVSLQKAYEELGRPEILKVDSYRRLKRGRSDLVGDITIAKRLGSWIKACETAGVPHGTAIREYAPPQYARAIDDLLACYRRLGHIPTFTEYIRFAQNTDHLSPATMRNYFGTWTKVRAMLTEIVEGGRDAATP